jgi:Flp pilus assembly protein TadG
MKFRYLWRRFLRSDNGSSAVEFAFAAPIVILIIAGIIDLMMVLFVTSLMEGGLQSASRLGRTGFQPAGITRTDAIRLEIQKATIGLVDMNDITITTSVYPCFDSIGQPEPYVDDNGSGSYDAGEPFTDVNGNTTWDSDMAASGLGGPGSIVLYEVFYNWAALTPLIGKIFGPDGTIPLSVSVAVRNEPFGTPAAVLSGPAGAGTTGC